MIWLATLCALCAGSAQPQNGRTPATLYVFDVSLKTLIPNKNIVVDNGNKVAELRREHYVTLQLAPGRHLVWLEYGAQRGQGGAGRTALERPITS